MSRILHSLVSVFLKSNLRLKRVSYGLTTFWTLPHTILLNTFWVWFHSSETEGFSILWHKCRNCPPCVSSKTSSFYVEYKVSDTNNRILKAKFEAITHSFAEQSHTQLPPNQKACVCHPPSPLLTESECQNNKGSYGLFSSHSLNKWGEGMQCRNRTCAVGNTLL